MSRDGWMFNIRGDHMTSTHSEEIFMFSDYALKCKVMQDFVTALNYCNVTRLRQGKAH